MATSSLCEVQILARFNDEGTAYNNNALTITEVSGVVQVTSTSQSINIDTRYSQSGGYTSGSFWLDYTWSVYCIFGAEEVIYGDNSFKCTMYRRSISGDTYNVTYHLRILWFKNN